MRIWNLLRYRLERMVVRGALYRVAFIAAVVGLVAVSAGLIVFEAGVFSRPDEAIWWAFLRLTDPGYLGDDEGLLRRVVSTVVTVLGYVLFLGALIAIMTQWLNAFLTKLQSGVTHIALDDHIGVLGWTNRTATILEQLERSKGRLRRFLSLHSMKELKVALLSRREPGDVLQELKDKLGNRWSDDHVVVRSGDFTRLDHLNRVDYKNAAVLVLPGTDFAEGGAASSDARIVKAMMNISQLEDDGDLPLLVAEVFDADKAPLLEQAYRGPVEVVPSRAILSRLIVQSMLIPGLSRLMRRLLSVDGGASLWIYEEGGFHGRSVADLRGALRGGSLIGVVRRDERGRYQSELAPVDDRVIEDGERLVLLSRNLKSISFSAKTSSHPSANRSDASAEDRAVRRVLIVGWSHKIPTLLSELDQVREQDFAVDVLSRKPAKERKRRKALHGKSERVKVRDIEGDYMSRSDLEDLDVAQYDSIVVMASDHIASEEDADARSVVAYLLFRELLLPLKKRPQLIVEVLDPNTEALIDPAIAEVIVSPSILSFLLSQIALRAELGPVIDELFGLHGADFRLRQPDELGLRKRHMTADDVVEAPIFDREIPIAARKGGGEFVLLRDLEPDQKVDEVLVLTPSRSG